MPDLRISIATPAPSERLVQLAAQIAAMMETMQEVMLEVKLLTREGEPQLAPAPSASAPAPPDPLQQPGNAWKTFIQTSAY